MENVTKKTHFMSRSQAGKSKGGCCLNNKLERRQVKCISKIKSNKEEHDKKKGAALL